MTEQELEEVKKRYYKLEYEIRYKKYKERHPEKVKEDQDNWYEKNKIKRKEQMRQYYENNKDKAHTYYENNKDKKPLKPFKVELKSGVNKICKKCLSLKDTMDFHIGRNSCKKCISDYSKNWEKNNTRKNKLKLI